MEGPFLASILTFYDEETKEWNSVALEMDIWGYGRTAEDAIANLNELVCMQISFALFKGQPEMIWHRAEDFYWNLLEEARRAELIQHLGQSVIEIGSPRNKEKKYSSSLPFPSPQVIEKKRKEFISAV